MVGELNAMDIITPKNGEHFIFLNEDGTAKLSGRDQGIRKCTWKRDQPERGEELRDDLRGESDGSQPIDTMMDDTDARNDFWSIEGNWYIYRHHVEPRVQLHVPKEEWIIPNTTAIFWRGEENTYFLGCVPRMRNI